MQPSPELNGMVGPWAAANFQDAIETSPTAVMFDLGGNGGSAPYTAAVNGLLLKHLDEVKQKSLASLALPHGWKKRLRDFMSAKNTDLLDFLSLSISSHPTLSKGDTILRKFGNINLHANHPSVRDLVLDSSGADVISEISATLLSLRTEDSLKDYLGAVRYIYDQYREAGEEALKAEAELKARLETLDKIQSRLVTVVDLDPNESYGPLLEATEAYLGRIFEKNQIKDQYLALIAAYRRFLALRDVVLMTRAIHAQENEPLCTICLHDAVSSCITPCGHTFCGTCVKKQVGTCFICRGPIKEKVKLYFG